MSITFTVKGEHSDWEKDPGSYLNLANGNAYDLFRWLGLERVDRENGEMCALALGALCKARLALKPENIDPAHDPIQHAPNFITCGRAEGYLHDRCADLLALCLRAGDGFIVWG